MWNIIKYGALLVVGILAYNYFFGTPEEKQNAKENIGKITSVISSAVKGGIAILKDERQKFKEGKYDNAIENVSGLISKIKDKVKAGGGALLDRIEDLEARKDDISKKLKEAESKDGGMTEDEKEALTKEFEELTDETEKVLKESEKE